MSAEFEEGRRERKKRETRAALQEAASRLFREQGFAGTTVQQIADAAEVSARTFFRYFESKEELLLPDLVELLASVERALAARPLAEAPLASVCEATRSTFGGLAGSATAFLGANFDPALTAMPGALVRAFLRWEDRLAAVLHQRFIAGGSDPRDEGVRLCAAVIARAAISAVRSAIRGFRSAPGADHRRLQTFDAYLRDAFMILESGCTVPRQGQSAAG